MQFDSKVGIQQVIALLTALFGLAAAYFTLKSDIRIHEDKLLRQETTLRELQAQQSLLNQTLYDIRRDMAVVRYQIERRPDKEIPKE